MISGWNKLFKQASWPAFFSCALYACLILVSCNNRNQPKAGHTADTTAYFPINNYIRQQVIAVDTTPYYVYRILVTNGKKDSVTISRATFDSLTQLFILPELEEGAMKKHFTESVYQDQSTSSITLTYTSKDSSIIVQNAMVLLDTVLQNVKWVFINTLQNRGDSTLIQKIGWKGDESCYFNRSVSYADGRKNETQLNIVWNKK